MDEPTSYFRFDEVRYGTGYTDVHGEYVSTGSYAKLQLREYQVIKQTPRGVRINDYRLHGNGRFISRDWNKQWACPTIEEARQSFIARKKRQMLILGTRLKQAEEALLLAQRGEYPREVSWYGPQPSWARRTDETAEIGLEESRLRGLEMMQDWALG